MKSITALFTFSAGISSILSVNASLANESLLHLNAPNSKFESKAFTFCQGSNIFDRNVLDLNSDANPVEVITETKVLSFGESFSYDFASNTTWVLKNADTQTTLDSGSGSILNMPFDTPGNYLIEVNEILTCLPGDCQHSHSPNLISIYVSPYKLTFDFSTVQFDEEITGDIDYTDLTVTVVANYQHYNNEDAVFTASNIRSAGVETNFVGALDPNFTQLSIGMNELVFKINGKAKKGTYIMFDFLDFNNQVQSFYYPTKIN